jgi:hypothetical protein
LYLTITAISMLISSYAGGYLKNYLDNREIFLITSMFPLLTIVSGIFIAEKNDHS